MAPRRRTAAAIKKCSGGVEGGGGCDGKTNAPPPKTGGSNKKRPRVGKGSGAAVKEPRQGGEGDCPVQTSPLHRMAARFNRIDSFVQQLYKEDPMSPTAIATRNFLMRRHYPVSIQIQMHLLPVLEGKFLPSGFYDPIEALPFEERDLAFRKYVVECVGPFVMEGNIVLEQLNTLLQTWSPDLKQVASTIKKFAELARPLQLTDLSKWCDILEEACVKATDPLPIYCNFEKIRDFFMRGSTQLWILLYLVDPDAVKPSTMTNQQ